MKTTTKSLKLSKDTLRLLSTNDLAKVPGGMMNNSNLTHCWASGCGCPPNY